MRIGTSYKQHPVTRDYDAIVIGSGIGGLGVAALLAKHAGKRVLVLERHYTAGGFTHTFTRPGYEWDVGVHYIGQVSDRRSTLRALFDDVSDGELEWADMGDVYDTIVIGSDRYDLVKGRDRFVQSLADAFPGERQAIERYLERVTSTVKKAQRYFTEKALPSPLATLVGPWLRRPLLEEARRTTREVLESTTEDPRLRAVLAGQYGDYGLPPARSSFFMHALVAHHYLDGGAYPVGGASRIAQTILPVIQRAGGDVYTNAEVAEILVEGRRAVGVRLAEDGRELRAPVVISDAGARLTYGRLLPEVARSRLGLLPKLEAIEPSVSHVSLYVGLRGTADQLGLRKGNLWLYPGDDHDASVERFVADPEAPLPVVYLSFPSAKDPDFQRRHPGKATIEVVTLAPYSWFSKWSDTRWGRRGDDYDTLKRRIADRMLEALYRECPQVRDAIEHCELSTPLSTRHFAGHPAGEIYGLAHTPARFEQRWLRPRTPIPGLFLTGADVASAGVAGALSGAALAASAVLGRNMLAASVRSGRAIPAKPRRAAA
jgi:all-trans-retinol 13,14-reductase